MPWSRKQTSLFKFDGNEPGLDEGVRLEITRAFTEHRAFPFFLDTGILSKLKTNKYIDSYKNQFVKIKNDIFNSIAGDNHSLQNQLSKSSRLSYRVINGISLIHRTISDINNPKLFKRRFMLIKERPESPGLYMSEAGHIVISHIGLGAKEKETPTIYLGLNLIDLLTQEFRKRESVLFACFKSILLVEERAIETGFSHLNQITPSVEKNLNIILEKLIQAHRVGEEALEVIIEGKTVKKFSREQRQAILKMLDARLPGNDLNFDYNRNQRAIEFLERFARHFKKGNDIDSLREVVRLLVAASGHDYHEIRNRANIALERVLAPKEYDAPPATCFFNVKPGESHNFNFDLSPDKDPYFVRIYKNRSSKEFTCEKELDFFDLNLFKNEKTNKYTAKISFDTLGHYDFVVFSLDQGRKQWITGRDFSGRINVIPDVRGEIILEIFPDIFGHSRAYWRDKDGHTGLVYNENGEVIRTGRFSDITAHLEELKKNYFITAIYLLGVQKRGSNREDWAEQATSPSPFSPMSLTSIEPFLGGGVELKRLIEKAHSLGIKIILDIVPHLNRHSTELSDDNIVKCYNNSGNLVRRSATDGRYGSWDDGMLLNYRRLEIWEWLAESILKLIDDFDIDGIRFDSAHSVPIMMKKNNYPYFFGEKRSHEELVEGTIIQNDREDDHFITTGYYDSSCREWISVPLHYYIMLAIEKKLIQKNKTFFINIAECYWGRERFLARTGIVPYNSSLFKICENIIHGKSDTREIYHLYNSHYASVLPKGTEMLGILGNHDERRALNTFGPLGMKAAIGLISFLSNIIMDYEGSVEGENWNVALDNIYVNWNQFRYMSQQGPTDFYHECYSFHRQEPGRGYLIGTNNNMVAAAMKASGEKIWIGAFNFSENSQTIHFEFKNPSIPILNDAFYRIVDPIYSSVTGHYNFYTGRELRVSQLQTIVSYTDRVKYLTLEKINNVDDYYYEFLRDSLFRLCTLSNPSHIHENFAFLEIAAHTGSFETFVNFFLDFLAPNFWKHNKDQLLLSLKRAFFHIVKNGIEPAEKVVGYFSKLVSQKEERLHTLGKYLKEVNRKGPIVFLSAEAEPFSKSGGLANVVYELPRELAALGEEVYVITPHYWSGENQLLEKMKKAFNKYHVSYTGRKVRFFLKDVEYEVGIHYGKVDGIHFFLLDHHEIFDGLYWGYNAEDKIRRRIGFARAAAELITTFAIKPMFIFTNDAYVGPFNGIVRCDSHYFKNLNYKDTAFFHIIHNGGWQYFDSYYRYENGTDQFNFFNLPEWQFDKFSDPVYKDNINCMASGIKTADRVITVSPSYAKHIEISSDGLESILNNVIGISNSIGKDFPSRIKKRMEISGFVDKWYPVFLERIKKEVKTYEKIKTRYPELLNDNLDDITDKQRLEILTRMRNKLLLQTARGFEIDPDIILLTMIHRISEQKGFQILLEASEGIFKTLNYQGILGGSVAWGDLRARELAQGLRLLQDFYPRNVSVNIGFQDICIPYLCSDVFLMPSMYEPGGISQLEAFASGCFVVARATGGLRDTVIPLQVRNRTVNGNGILFTDYTPGALYDAMERFKTIFQDLDDNMRSEARNNVSNNVRYWDNSAREYLRTIYSFKEIIHPYLRENDSQTGESPKTT